MGNTLDPTGKPLYTATPTQTTTDLNEAVKYAEKVGGLLKVTSGQRSSLTASQTKVGWLISETDTGSVYVRTTDAPQGVPLMLADTGWQDIELNPGWAGRSGEPPRWRVKSGWLQLAGRANGSPGATVELGRLPAAARHTSSLMVFRVHMDNNVAGVTVDSGGLVAVFEPGQSAARPGIALAAVSYIVG